MSLDLDKLYALIPRKRRDDPVDQTSCTWMPSLEFIARQALAENIMKVISSEAETGWQNPGRMMELKVFLQQNLPQLLLEEICRKYFDFYISEYKLTCMYCEVILKNVLKKIHWHKFFGTEDYGIPKFRLILAWNLLRNSDIPYDQYYLGVDSFEDIMWLSKNNFSVAQLRIKTSRWSLEDIEEALKSLPNLKFIQLHYDTEERDGKEFDLMKRFCKLKKLFITGRLKTLIPTCEFITFLGSQSETLNDLLLDGHFTDEQESSIVSLRRGTWIWEVLTLMPNLKKLRCHLNGIKIFQEIPDLVPCRQICSLLVDLGNGSEQVLETLEIDRLFPSLHTLCFVGREVSEIVDINIRQKATHVLLRECADPFKMMSFLPNVKRMCLHSGNVNTSVPRSLPPLMLHLTELSLGSSYILTQDEFSSLFRSLPSIEHMELWLRALHSYQEDQFIAFVEESVNSLKNLHSLKLSFLINPPTMTGKTVCAILKNSSLREFRGLSEFKFTPEDFELLKSLAADRQLVITSWAQQCCSFGHNLEHEFQDIYYEI